MKNKYIILILILFLLLPFNVYANGKSESAIKGYGTGDWIPASSCIDVMRQPDVGGVRITFVDASGQAVAESGGQSYDFITNKDGLSDGIKYYYNNYSGDRNKIAMAASHGNFSKSGYDKTFGSTFKFHELAAAFNNFAEIEGSAHRANFDTSRYSGGNQSAGFSTEMEFFRNLTISGNEYFVEDVNAFVRAMAYITGGFNAEDLLLKMSESCTTNEEIFIIMEPIFFWWNCNESKNYWGTLSDAYFLFNQSFSSWSYHKDEMMYVMYYNRTIDAFKGASAISKGDFQILTAEELLSNAGYAMGVDWATDDSAYCQSCSFVNGKFTYDNKIEGVDLVIPSKFGSIQEYAFADRSAGGAGCCTAIESQLNSLSSAWNSAYQKMCIEQVEGECCTDDPIEVPDITGQVYNCCYDNTESWAKEHDLNDLFCYDNDMLVDEYYKKCNADYYLEDDMTSELNDYCEIYCTERVYVSIPSAITATSGRYFQLTTTAKGTKSPYVEGYKRCRTIIDYDKWHADYLKIVEDEIEAYNTYQRIEANSLMYQDSIAASYSTSESITVTCTIQHRSDSDECNKVTKACTNGKFPDGTACTSSESDSCSAHAESVDGGTNPTKTFTLTYTRYPFTTLSTYPRKYHNVELDETYENASINLHNTITMKYKNTEYTSHSDWSAWDIRSQISEIESYLNSYNGKDIDGTSRSDSSSDGTCSCSATSGNSYWSCSRNYADAESRQEDVVSVQASLESQAQGANGTYNQIATNGKLKEQELYVCDNYFVNGKGTDVEGHYDFEANFGGFQYSQQYLDVYGEIQGLTETVDFEEDPGCVFYGPYLGPDSDDGLISPQYSSYYYGEVPENMIDFKIATLVWEETTTGYQKYRDDIYAAEKKFTQDAKYKVVCSWNEPTDTKYTLIPSGQVNYSTTNYTKNGRQYSVLLTTLDGTFDTKWILSGLGSNSKFDSFFRENGQVCSTRQTAQANGLFHCGITIQHEITYTGKCNPSGGGKTVVDSDECTAASTSPIVLSFKIVDPEDIFTSCDSYESCGYAYNWFKGTNGTSTMNKIQAEGAKSTTYSPDNQTYSFTLTPSDMKVIKNYNTYEESYGGGGYSDFNLTCSCPSDVDECSTTVGGTQTCKRSSSCNTCYSTFITNLYSGIVSYGGTEHSVTTATGTLQSIRDNNHWVS